MFNYAAADRYIPLADFIALARYFEASTQDPSFLSGHMLQGIERCAPGGHEYLVHLNAESSGYTLRFRIEGGQVTCLAREGFWMS